MIAAEGMRQGRVPSFFILCLISGCRHLRHTPRRSIRCYFALIAVLGRALSTSYAPLPARVCLVSFPLLGYMTVSLTVRYHLPDDATARVVIVLLERE